MAYKHEPTAAQRFWEIGELVEMTLLECDTEQILKTQRIKNFIHGTIQNSSKLKTKMFLLPMPSQTFEQRELARSIESMCGHSGVRHRFSGFFDMHVPNTTLFPQDGLEFRVEVFPYLVFTAKSSTRQQYTNGLWTYQLAIAVRMASETSEETTPLLPLAYRKMLPAHAALRYIVQVSLPTPDDEPRKTRDNTLKLGARMPADPKLACEEKCVEASKFEAPNFGDLLEFIESWVASDCNEVAEHKGIISDPGLAYRVSRMIQ